MGPGEASRIATAAIASSGAAMTRASPASTTSTRRLTTPCPPPARPGLVGEPAPGALTPQQPRQQPQDHVAVRHGHSVVQRGARVVRRDGELRLVDDGARVHGFGEPEEGVAAHALAADQCPIDRRTPAVLWQQGGVRADHADTGQRERLGAKDLAPADHEYDIQRESTQQLARLDVVDAGDLIQRDVVALAECGVVGGPAARRGDFARERDDALHRDAGLEYAVERRKPFLVTADPAEPHRRWVRTTSRTASMTSATSASERRGLSGRLSIRS